MGREPNLRGNGEYLTATQKGAVAENIVASRIISASRGRLSPFLPVADDGGVDLLVFDKKTQSALPVQVKSRTVTVKGQGRRVRFQIRKSTFSELPGMMVLGMFFDWQSQQPRWMWLLPGDAIAAEATDHGIHYVLTPSMDVNTHDKWKQYRFNCFDELVRRLMDTLERSGAQQEEARPEETPRPDVWKRVKESVKPGQELLTPGRGIPPVNQRPFWVRHVGRNFLTIEVGKSGFSAKVPVRAFEAVTEHLRTHIGTLRIAASHANQPLPGSVDEVVRRAAGWNLASGNYVAAILEHAGLVEYVMKGDQKHVALC